MNKKRWKISDGGKTLGNSMAKIDKEVEKKKQYGNKEKTGKIRNEENDKISIQSGTRKIVKKFWRDEDKN